MLRGRKAPLLLPRRWRGLLPPIHRYLHRLPLVPCIVSLRFARLQMPGVLLGSRVSEQTCTRLGGLAAKHRPLVILYFKFSGV